MARKKFSDQAVARWKAPAQGRAEYWDEEKPGFGMRITTTGAKVWQLMYRANGTKRRLTLGAYPTLSLSLARKAADQALEVIAKGRDPAAERTVFTGGLLTFEQFSNAYIERHAKRHKKSWMADQSMIVNDLVPAWGRRPAQSIARRDVFELLETVVARGHPYAANRRLALIRKMFAWGMTVDLVANSPTVGVSAPTREQVRSRILSETEIIALWSAWDQMAYPYGVIYKLILLTAQRRTDIASLRLNDIGFTSQIWTPPQAVSNPGSVHELPLSIETLEILASLPRSQGQLVFPSSRNRSKPVSGFSKAAERVTTLSGVCDWRTQDLRRTAAVGMAKMGVAPDLLDQILNVHVQHSSGIRGIYQLAADAEQKRQALQKWSAQVFKIISEIQAQKS